MVGRTSDWREELGRWLRPFLDRLGHKARRQMCPLYVNESEAGVIQSHDREFEAIVHDEVSKAASVSVLPQMNLDFEPGHIGTDIVTGKKHTIAASVRDAGGGRPP